MEEEEIEVLEVMEIERENLNQIINLDLKTPLLKRKKRIMEILLKIKQEVLQLMLIIKPIITFLIIGKTNKMNKIMDIINK